MTYGNGHYKEFWFFKTIELPLTVKTKITQKVTGKQMNNVMLSTLNLLLKIPLVTPSH